MYRCDSCMQTIGPNKPCNVVPTGFKEWQHPRRAWANRDGSEDPGGSGMQIVGQIKFCDDCQRGKESQ